MGRLCLARPSPSCPPDAYDVCSPLLSGAHGCPGRVLRILLPPRDCLVFCDAPAPLRSGLAHRIGSRFYEAGSEAASSRQPGQGLSVDFSISSVTRSSPTLCDPMDCSTPGLPVYRQLLELAQTHVHRVGDASSPFPFPPIGVDKQNVVYTYNRILFSL